MLSDGKNSNSFDKNLNANQKVLQNQILGIFKMKLRKK